MFHTARGLNADEAEELVQRATMETAAIARRAVRRLIDDLRAVEHEVICSGIVLASGRPASSLAQALSSHAAIHTAEGEMYRTALVQASEQHGLQVTGVRARDLYQRGAAILNIPIAELRRRVTELRRDFGPPWGQDQKEAALVAWLALAAAGEVGSS